ncbi:hypothetical protein [Pararhizobium mangrovi]|nr:hypothetical protein [Pararhizobium mangrovi]
MNTLAFRFTIFTLIICALAAGMSFAVLKENRAVLPYQSGVHFR